MSELRGWERREGVDRVLAENAKQILSTPVSKTLAGDPGLRESQPEKQEQRQEQKL
jgi:hypothetical protein